MSIEINPLEPDTTSGEGILLGLSHTYTQTARKYHKVIQFDFHAL